MSKGDRRNDILNASNNHFKNDVIPETQNKEVLDEVLDDVIPDTQPSDIVDDSSKKNGSDTTLNTSGEKGINSPEEKGSKKTDKKELKQTLKKELGSMKRKTRMSVLKNDFKRFGQSAIGRVNDYHQGGDNEADVDAIGSFIQGADSIQKQVKTELNLRKVSKEVKSDLMRDRDEKSDLLGDKAKSDTDSQESKKDSSKAKKTDEVSTSSERHDISSNSSVLTPNDSQGNVTNSSILDTKDIQGNISNQSVLDTKDIQGNSSNSSVLKKESSQGDLNQSKTKESTKKGKGKETKGEKKLKDKARKKQKNKKLKSRNVDAKNGTQAMGKIALIGNIAQKISQLESPEATLQSVMTSKVTVILMGSSMIILLLGAVFMMGIMLLFGFKSEEFELVKTYSYITELDNKMSKKINVLNKHNDEVYVNDVRVESPTFKYYSDIDSFLLFMDIKYEDYKFDSLINGVFGGTNIKSEVQNLHDKLYDIKTTTEGSKTVAHVTTHKLSEVITTKDGVTKSDIKNIKDLSEFDNYIKFAGLSNPLRSDTKYLVVNERYEFNNQFITLKTTREQPILATIKGEVIQSTDSSLTIKNKNKRVVYENIKPSVNVGDEVKRGNKIGTSDSELGNEFTLAYDKKKKLSWKVTIPSFYFKDTERRFFTYYEKINSRKIDYEKVDSFLDESLKERVIKECAEQGIESHVDLILSMIEVEKGSTDDPLNSEKYLGKDDELEEEKDDKESEEESTSEETPDEPSLQEKNLQKGIAYFVNLLTLAKENKLSEESAIQGFHMGEEFINELVKTSQEFSYTFCDEYATDKTNANYSRDVLKKLETPQNMLSNEAKKGSLDYFKDYLKLDDESFDELNTSYFREQGLFRKRIEDALEGDVIHISERGGEKQTLGIITNINENSVTYFDLTGDTQSKQIDSLDIVGYSKLY